MAGTLEVGRLDATRALMQEPLPPAHLREIQAFLWLASSQSCSLVARILWSHPWQQPSRCAKAER